MQDDLTEVRVFAPATLANLGCGYDVLGLAIYGPGDEILIRKTHTSKDLTVSHITGDDGKLPLDVAQNTAAIAAQAVLNKLNLDCGFEMEIHKKMPFGSGLGSSAASAVGGAFAMNEILGSPLERHDLLDAAMQGEQAASKAWHADNVAPGLLGGICLIRDNPSLDVVNLPVPKDFWITIIYDPKIEILTADARDKVPTQVDTHKATSQAGHLAAFVAALYDENYDLLQRAVVDQIAEPGRRDLIPRYDQYKQMCLDAGALCFGISGSGPSLFAISYGELSAHKIASTFDGIPVETYVSKVNTQGVVRLT